jgi:hypothetical protein
VEYSNFRVDDKISSSVDSATRDSLLRKTAFRCPIPEYKSVAVKQLAPVCDDEILADHVLPVVHALVDLNLLRLEA